MEAQLHRNSWKQVHIEEARGNRSNNGIICDKIHVCGAKREALNACAGLKHTSLATIAGA